jgi:hypothetical protein
VQIPGKCGCEKDGNLRDLDRPEKGSRSVIENAGLDHPIKIERWASKDCSRKTGAADIYLGKDVMVVEIQKYAGRSRIRPQKTPARVAHPSVLLYHRSVIIYRGL